MGNCAPEDSMLLIPSLRLTAPLFNADGIGDDVVIKNEEEEEEEDGDDAVKLYVGVAEREDMFVN